LRKKFILLLIALIFILPVLPVGATPATRERFRQQYEQQTVARQAVREQQNLLAGTRHEMSQLLAEMQEIDQQLADAAEAIEANDEALYAIEVRISYAEADLDTARKEYDLHMEILRERVRGMHEHGSLGMLDVLFQAESIFDFFTRWELMRVAAQFDRDLLASLEEAESRVLSNVDDLARMSMQIEDLQWQQMRAKEELDLVLARQQLWFADLADDEAKMAELLAIFEEEQRAAEASFAEIQARLHREETEMARAAAAEARAVSLARLNNFDGQFMWPIPTHGFSGRPGASFGMRMHPILRVYRHHSGIDVGAPTGTRLYAAADGYVRFAGWSGGYGNTVIIDHGNGYSTLYAHNSRNRVTAGQFVRRGEHIADVGSTGMSTGPHLHFEIRINNRAVDPMLYFPV